MPAPRSIALPSVLAGGRAARRAAMVAVSPVQNAEPCRRPSSRLTLDHKILENLSWAPYHVATDCSQGYI